MQLNDRINIQKFINEADEEGFNKESWNDYYNCWARFKTVGWKEYYSAKAIQAENTVTFTIRYSPKIKAMLDDPSVTKKYRVVYKSKNYDIKYINDLDNKHEYVDIKAEIIT